MRHTPYVRAGLIGVTVSFMVFFSDLAGFLEPAELKSLDLRFRFRGPLAPEIPIVLVSIDEDSFDEINLPWPWERTLHATVLRKLADAGARIIGVDILLTEPKPDSREDRDLARAIREAGNVILASEFTKVESDFGPKMSMRLPIPQLRQNALGFGTVNMETDVDGVVRRSRTAMTFQGHLYPSFGYEIYDAAAADSGPAPEGLTQETIINFRGPPRSYPIVPYYRVLRDEIDRSLVQNRIVLIGAFAPSLHDSYPTPFGARQHMAGVEIQANFLHTLLTGNGITPLPRWARATLFLLLSVLAIAASVRFKPVGALCAVIALAAGLAISAVYAFSAYQIWVPIVPPLVGSILAYGSVTLDGYVREQRERLRLRATFAKYVSNEVMEEILNDRQGLSVAGKRKHITVLFCDIRGFTAISEQIGPERVVTLLSSYLAGLSRIVLKHKGTVDKFIGDAVMAVFGAPTSYGDDAIRAVKTGLDILQYAESESSKWMEAIGRPLKVGVGIHSGDAVVGSIGSEVRSDFTAIGDAVNLASRLESLTKELDIPMLMSEQTVAELRNAIPVLPLQRVKVMGRQTPLLVYAPEALLRGKTGSSDFEGPYVQQQK